jgi:hypothetical protein
MSAPLANPARSAHRAATSLAEYRIDGTPIVPICADAARFGEALLLDHTNNAENPKQLRDDCVTVHCTKNAPSRTY